MEKSTDRVLITQFQIKSNNFQSADGEMLLSIVFS